MILYPVPVLTHSLLVYILTRFFFSLSLSLSLSAFSLISEWSSSVLISWLFSALRAKISTECTCIPFFFHEHVLCLSVRFRFLFKFFCLPFSRASAFTCIYLTYRILLYLFVALYLFTCCGAIILMCLEACIRI